MTTTTLNRLAGAIMSAQDKQQSFSGFSSELAQLSTADAYQLAGLIHQRRVANRWRPIGRKLGFTNRDLWRQFAVSAPIWGYLYEHTTEYPGEHPSQLAAANYLEPRLEPEIALHFYRSPRPGDDLTAVLSCIDWIAHGFEIVQSHYPRWQFNPAQTIVDNALHGSLILGPPLMLSDSAGGLVEQLRDFTVSLACNQQTQATGSGANVLGSPLEAIRHLLELLSSLPANRQLSAGEIVITGSLTDALSIHAGEQWRTTIDGIALAGLTLAVN